MTTHDLTFAPDAFGALFIGVLIWISIKSSKTLKAVMARSRSIIDESKATMTESKLTMAEAKANAQKAVEQASQHLEILKEILAETKALRVAVENKQQ